MIDKKALCEQIKTLYPDLGTCGIDIHVDYDPGEKSWVVFLNKGNRKIKHFLPETDADACMLGRQCIGLGIEIAQFR